MKRIVNGRLFDDTFCKEVQSRTFESKDPVTGEGKQYRERLYREYVLKPGHTVADSWVEGQYGGHVVEDHCDLGKGLFWLVVSQGWNDGIVVPLGEEGARRWMEEHHPEDVDTYTKVFGVPENPWREDGKVDLVEQAESRCASMKWDKERAEERAGKAEAELAQLRARLESLTKAPEATGSAGVAPEATGSAGGESF